MKRKTVICSIGVLLAVCVVCGVMYATHRGQAKNDVFTDDFFKGMTGIEPFMVPGVRLEGQAADSVVSYLKSLRLEPTEDPLPGSDEIRYGGNQGFCVYYQDGSNVHFAGIEAMVGVGYDRYYVVDKNGEPITDFGETLWNLFYPEGYPPKG